MKVYLEYILNSDEINIINDKIENVVNYKKIFDIIEIKEKYKDIINKKYRIISINVIIVECKKIEI